MVRDEEAMAAADIRWDSSVGQTEAACAYTEAAACSAHRFFEAARDAGRFGRCR